MKCSQIQEVLLTDFLDDCLSLDKKKVVEDHLSGCSACRELLAEARQMDMAIKTMPVPEEVPVSVWLGITEKLEQPSYSWQDFFGFRGNFRFVYGSVMAGLLVVMFVAGPVLSQRRAAIAKADTETLMQLVYADEEVSTVEWDQVAGGVLDGDLL